MREPSLKETTLISILLHSFVLFMVLFVVKSSPRINLPSPYVVTLVSPAEVKKTAKITTKKTEEPKPLQQTPVKRQESSLNTEEKSDKSKADIAAIKEIKRKRQNALIKTKKTYKKDITKKPVKSAPKKDTTYEDTIAALRAKKRIEERVMKKRQVLSVRKKYLSKEGATGLAVNNMSDKAGSGDIITSYYEQVQDKIWAEWVYPEFRLKEDLLAIINIKILRDGKVKILGIEKSSGNSLFDRSAMRAIRKASPLPPPPYEIELGVRFTP